MNVKSLLLTSEVVKIQTTDFSSSSKSLFSVQQKMSTKRLASRRASAGIQMNLGVRRKSVVPLSQQQMLAKKELDGFEKHTFE